MHPLRLFDALELSVRLQRFDLTEMHAMIARNPGRHGLKPLQAQLARLSAAEPAWLDSKLEAEFLFQLRQHPDLPEPLTHQLVEGEPVDFYWPEHRVVVELDGDLYHSLPSDRLDERPVATASSRSRVTASCAVSELEFKTDSERMFADLRSMLNWRRDDAVGRSVRPGRQMQRATASSARRRCDARCCPRRSRQPDPARPRLSRP